MAKFKDLVIPFSGMSEGKYNFEIELDNTFFESLEFSIIKKGEVKVQVEMDRRQLMLTFDIAIDGSVEMECDRCGNMYRQPIETDCTMVVNLNADHFEDVDDLINLPASYNEFDLAQYVYEYISLAVPAKLLCPEVPGCDPEVISKLEKLKSGDNDNANTSSDPRWDALKKFKDNN